LGGDRCGGGSSCWCCYGDGWRWSARAASPRSAAHHLDTHGRAARPHGDQDPPPSPVPYTQGLPQHVHNKSIPIHSHRCGDPHIPLHHAPRQAPRPPRASRASTQSDVSGSKSYIRPSSAPPSRLDNPHAASSRRPSRHTQPTASRRAAADHLPAERETARAPQSGHNRCNAYRTGGGDETKRWGDLVTVFTGLAHPFSLPTCALPASLSLPSQRHATPSCGRTRRTASLHRHQPAHRAVCCPPASLHSRRPLVMTRPSPRHAPAVAPPPRAGIHCGRSRSFVRVSTCRRVPCRRNGRRRARARGDTPGLAVPHYSQAGCRVVGTRAPAPRGSTSVSLTEGWGRRPPHHRRPSAPQKEATKAVSRASVAAAPMRRSTTSPDVAAEPSPRHPPHGPTAVARPPAHRATAAAARTAAVQSHAGCTRPRAPP